MTGAVRRWLWRVPWALPAVVAALVAMAAVVAVVCWWDWLRSVPESSDSGGETLRTLALILVAIAGLFFAWWRNRIAGRQAETANEQAKTAERGLRNERYQKGADMLGNATLVTRFGGVYALEQLARDHPEEYHVPIVDLLCAFIRHPVEEGRSESGGADGGGPDGSVYEPDRRCAPHIEAAAKAIGRRSVENDPSGFLNLRGANLSGADLRDANLSGTDLWGANLSGADLRGDASLSGASLWDTNLEGAMLFGANLSGATLFNTNLESAILSKANLEGAILSKANLRGATLSHVKGLTQSGRGGAFIREGKAPPRLEGALDAETGKPLVWGDEERPPEDGQNRAARQVYAVWEGEEHPPKDEAGD